MIFPNAKLVVLEKNRRSTSPILRTAFALIRRKSPGIFAGTRTVTLGYNASPLQSASEEEAVNAGAPLPSPPVVGDDSHHQDAGGPNIVSSIRDLQKKMRCKWSDFGILYRSHYHRDEVVQELAEADIPFVIESMDVSDTPEARDLFACLNAVVSRRRRCQSVSRRCLPRFHVDPEQLRQVMRAIPARTRDPGSAAFNVLVGSKAARRFGRGAGVRGRDPALREPKPGPPCEIIVQAVFALDRASPPICRPPSFRGANGKRRRSTRRPSSRSWSTISGTSARRRRDSLQVERNRKCRSPDDRAWCQGPGDSRTFSSSVPTPVFPLRVQGDAGRFSAGTA